MDRSPSSHSSRPSRCTCCGDTMITLGHKDGMDLPLLSRRARHSKFASACEASPSAYQVVDYLSLRSSYTVLRAVAPSRIALLLQVCVLTLTLVGGAARPSRAQLRPIPPDSIGHALRCAPRSAFALGGVRLGESVDSAIHWLTVRTGERVLGRHVTDDPELFLHYDYSIMEVGVKDRGRGPIVEALWAMSSKVMTPSGLRADMTRAAVRRIVGPIASGRSGPRVVLIPACHGNAEIAISFDERGLVGGLGLQMIHGKGSTP